MKFRAIAQASERTNAIGTVELECTPEGLGLAFVRVGAFAEGYAPPPPTEGTHLLVPWPRIEAAQLEGERLFLAFEPELAPHHRLLLGHFASGTRIHHHELYKRRLLVRVTGVAGSLIAGLVCLSAAVRMSPERGPAVAIVVALLAGAVILGIALMADRFLMHGGLESEEAREAFVRELGSYFGGLARLPEPAQAPRPQKTLADFQGLLPRTTFAIVVTLTASGLGAVLMGRYLLTNEREREQARTRERASRPAEIDDRANPPESEGPDPAPQAPAAPTPKLASTQASKLPPAAAASGDLVSLGEPCRCQRASSPLWAEPLPRLSILVLSHKIRNGRGEDESKRKKYSELEVAVVNNSNEDISEVALLALFYTPHEGKERELVSNRPLFYEGPLVPGQALKWSVEAEGTEFEIQNPILGTIGDDGEKAAPADRVAELLEANHRPVRLHGALLLTFLGDARAREGVLRLREAAREDEAPYLIRLLNALADVRACRLDFDPNRGNVRGCLYNASHEPKQDLGLKLRGLDRAPNHEAPTEEPPSLLFEKTYAVSAPLEPETGRAFSANFEAGTGVKALEAVSDRADLLR